MTLTELWDALEAHDWYYPMSDDPRVYNAGQAAKRRLEAQAAQVDGGVQLLARFSAHYFSGPSWGSAEQPKPPRP